MKEVKETVYITEDGKKFLNKELATAYEQSLNKVKAFRVDYCPDLIEGRGLQQSGIVWVNASSLHRSFVEEWCYNQFGNRFGFVMGAYHSNALVPRWEVYSAKEKDLEKYEVLARLAEMGATPIWS